MIEKLMNWLGYYKKSKRSDTYRPIEYRQFEGEFDCGDLLLEKMTEGNNFLRNRSKEDYECLGMFFSIVLMVEHKLVNLLLRFDPDIESKMFGQKVDVFKDFLKAYEPSEDDDMEVYKLLIQPLSQIKSVRNTLAHDIKSPLFTSKDINQVISYIKQRRPDLHKKYKDCNDDRGVCIGALASFVFIFSFEIAKLRISIA
ncbi:hypothetical protein C8J23_12012 [Shewanella chilikensis]|uniref:RiboL-PSP-HEPN domain-containing protein n=1 Tax=Shewanella chilikensis TaxID=558541 RepID=A0ABX5PLT0_9GAMM|nr:hypothetical protein [Shewanella chilikensis]MCL1152571.1 hypothetical protein [Shewanella chilikensis]MCL1152579.1 hypothetical protein [Shewanella chilikensis]PYE57562.1 hypothetical protein C8J23_12012 [Shewanella chilikensis]